MPNATIKVHIEHTQEWLVEHGWYASDEGWRHRALNGGLWGWPLTQAARLQTEAIEGFEGPVFDMLRGT